METKGTQEELNKIKTELKANFEEITEREYPKVYGKVTKVSYSGMSRHIDVFIVIDNDIKCLNWEVEKLGLFNRAKDGSLKVSGCGMDMIFHTWDSLFNSVMGYKWNWQSKIRMEHI